MNKHLILLGSLALLGAGCAIPGMPFGETADKTTDEKVAMCAQTPQVHFFNKLGFGPREITEIQANVVGPLVDYYRTLPGGGFQIVSIVIKRTATGITVDAIVDQPDSDEPVYHGFVHARTATGEYPRWYPEEVPPEYRG
ncbi:hypothetical protein K8R04_01065 [Candidatus Uhrbacteria bacterium]|nr:hypothetical protein [Candidatus Uhrbacteria bacterium]